MSNFETLYMPFNFVAIPFELPDVSHFSVRHCPVNTASTHIGSSCACRSVLSFGQSNESAANESDPIIPLFNAAVTVMPNWLYIQPMTFWSLLFAYFQ